MKISCLLFTSPHLTLERQHRSGARGVSQFSCQIFLPLRAPHHRPKACTTCRPEHPGWTTIHPLWAETSTSARVTPVVNSGRHE